MTVDVVGWERRIPANAGDRGQAALGEWNVEWSGAVAYTPNGPDGTGGTAYASMTDATVAFSAAHVHGSDTFTKAGAVVTATGATKRVRVELTAAETTGLQSGRWTYALVATLANASVVTLAAHRMTVHERI